MKKNKSIIMGAMFGVIIFGIIGVVAANINANSVSFNNEHTGFSSTTLDGAVDELITLVDETIANDKSSKVYTNGEIVYYNPVTNRGCTESEWNPSGVAESSVSQSSTGTKTGCMRWFAYLDEAGQDKVKLLLDHNTTATKAWSSSSSLPQSNIYADLVALVKTSGWKVQPTLIDAQDIPVITGKSNWYSPASNNNRFYFDSNTGQVPTTFGKYWWLNDRTYNCANYGCHTVDDSNYGYWTSTDTSYGDYNYVWYVNYMSDLNYIKPTSSNLGVRPVVEVYKANL